MRTILALIAGLFVSVLTYGQSNTISVSFPDGSGGPGGSGGGSILGPSLNGDGAQLVPAGSGSCGMALCAANASTTNGDPFAIVDRPASALAGFGANYDIMIGLSVGGDGTVLGPGNYQNKDNMGFPAGTIVGGNGASPYIPPIPQLPETQTFIKSNYAGSYFAGFGGNQHEGSCPKCHPANTAVAANIAQFAFTQVGLQGLSMGTSYLFEGFVALSGVQVTGFTTVGPISSGVMRAGAVTAADLEVRAILSSPLIARTSTDLDKFTAAWVEQRTSGAFTSTIEVMDEGKPTGIFISGGKNAGVGGEVNPAQYAGFSRGVDPTSLQNMIKYVYNMPFPKR